MKTLLYITVNSKPEQLSASKTVGRALVKKFLKCQPDFELQELNLYDFHIPRLEYQFFEKRNALIKIDDFNKLNEKDQEEAHKIVQLVEQFQKADMYIIAAPMWNLSFPAPLKEYLDCIIMDGKTISLKNGKVEGLLNDKQRGMIYVQSSGAEINLLTKLVLNRGLCYVKDLMKLMGIKRFEELLVDGTGTSDKEKQFAIDKALLKIDDVIMDAWR